MSRGSWQSAWRWSEEQDAAAIVEWDNSGLGAAAFARRHGVSAWRLYWWRRRLALPKQMTVAPRFVPAEIIGVSSARVRVRVASGALVEIEGADPAWVADLVRELGRLR